MKRSTDKRGGKGKIDMIRLYIYFIFEHLPMEVTSAKTPMGKRPATTDATW